VILTWLWKQRQLLGAGLGIFAVAALFYLYAPQDIIGRLKGVNWVLLFPLLIGLASMHLFQVELWRLLSRAIAGTQLPRASAITAYFAGQVVGGMTPGNVGGDLYRAVALKSDANGWRVVVAPILGQRAVSYSTLLLLAAGVVALHFVTTPLLALLCAGPVAVTLGVLWRVRQALVAYVLRGSGRLGIARESLTRCRHAAVPAYALAVAFHLGSVALTYAFLPAIGEHPPLFATLGVLLVVRTVALLPITPSGLGLQEGSLTLLLPTVGVSPEAALTVALLARLGMLTAMLVGVACFLGARLNRTRVFVSVAEASR
jgi:uncharacterized membrane protein YbhN (UPF0104 family)